MFVTPSFNRATDAWVLTFQEEANDSQGENKAGKSPRQLSLRPEEIVFKDSVLRDEGSHSPCAGQGRWRVLCHAL